MSIPRLLARLLALAAFVPPGLAAAQSASEWPLYAHDYDNSNHNAAERTIDARTAPFLRRSWETFNDDTRVSEPAPTGFVLESVLGLVYPAPVVGVVGSPIVRDGTIYWVDQLGTVFARDARTGAVLDPVAHWTTTLGDPDFAAGTPPFAPELYYTAPVVTDDHLWLLGSFYGRAHLVDRATGEEHDFDPATPGVQPFTLVPTRQVASVLGDPVVVTWNGATLLVVSINVIVNDALLQEGETGLYIAFDVTDPTQPIERWRTATIDDEPTTGRPYTTGVSAVSGLAVDLARGTLYGGTSQNTTAPYPEYPDPAFAPPGYVDRSDSLFAMDLDTGAFLWTNQFHAGDVFDLNNPVSTGPNRPDGPRDADVLAPPVLFRARVGGRMRDLVGDGSKGGLFRVADRDTGETVWERQISKPTGIGGIQGGAAFADGVLYVAGFEGLDDGFSDAQFGVSLATGLFPNAFFATFSPAFWADVEDVSNDGDPATGMRVKVYALDAGTGRSLWRRPRPFAAGSAPGAQELSTGPSTGTAARPADFVSLLAGASLRHVSVTSELVFVATSSGRFFALDRRDGALRFSDQSPDLDALFGLGLGKPHHASMNGGTVIADGRLFLPTGAQNQPSGGIMAYEVNHRPRVTDDRVEVTPGTTILIDALANDVDPNGDALAFAVVAGSPIVIDDGVPDVVTRSFGTFRVFNPGDDPNRPEDAYLELQPAPGFAGQRWIGYVVQDLAPARIVNGVALGEPNPTHRPRRDGGRIDLVPSF